jgi:hypothetical protein
MKKLKFPVVIMKLVDKSQAYFWTRKWQEGEKKTDEDIAAGKIKSFNTAKESLKDLA